MTQTNDQSAETSVRSELTTYREMVLKRPSRQARNPINYDADLVSLETGLECKDPSLAVQSQKDEADINYIVRQFGVTKQLPQVLTLPSYGDFEGVSDFHEAQNLIIEAQESFSRLPSALRAQFENDPRAFLEYVHDPANAGSLAQLGITPETGDNLFLFSPVKPSPLPDTGQPAAQET